MKINLTIIDVTGDIGGSFTNFMYIVRDKSEVYYLWYLTPFTHRDYTHVGLF